MNDELQQQQQQTPCEPRLAAWKQTLVVTVFFALVSLPFTKTLIGKTIPALENSTVGYIAFTTFIFFIVTLLVLQNSK